MIDSENFLIFLCSGAAKAGNKKLSYRLAIEMETLGFGSIGSLHNLSEQHSIASGDQKKMIFINDCKSGCVNVLTHGFDKNNFVYIDVSPFISQKEFDIINFIHSEIAQTLNTKWPARNN